MADLRLDWCSFEAAEFAVRAWHYSRSMPASRRVHVGAWEDGRFIGAVIFSRGNTPNIGRPFELSQSDICELTRVALRDHETPTSRVVAIALRMLRRQSPGLKLVVSYADPAHEHVGTIYQAGGWLYLGLTGRECLLHLNGRLRHPRTVGSRYGHRGVDWLRQHVDSDAARVVLPAKHKYVFPFDADLRARLLPLVQPYPKRGREAEGGRPVPTGRAGSSPSRPLHSEAAHV